MNYLVHIPQSNMGIEALITSEQRDEYLKRLEEYDETLTIDYSDDSDEEFYYFDREIDDFSVKEAKHWLTIAQESEDVEPEILDKHKWIREMYGQMKSNKTWIDEWFKGFDTIKKRSKQSRKKIR